MRVAVFSTKAYDRRFLGQVNKSHNHDLTFFETRLSETTAGLAEGHDAVCAFVNDDLKAPVLQTLANGGVKLVALRSAGFNNVDVPAADRLGITVARVPAYSPYAVAEHAVGLILTLSRKFHRAYGRVREGNFSLEGLLGFDLHGNTVGIIGTGTIGLVFAEIMRGFGCRLIASDPYPNKKAEELGVEYVELEDLFRQARIISLHCPLTPETHHIVNAQSLAQMQTGVVIINTGRGALINTQDAIDALKSRKIGYLGLDVYEEEADLFFEDLSQEVIHDDVFIRLMTFPNVLITGHQGFFTEEALQNIAETTLNNITAFERGEGEIHRVSV